MMPNRAPGSPVIQTLNSRLIVPDSVREIQRIRDSQSARQSVSGAVLSWGLENSPDKAESFVVTLIALVRGKGGFRAGSSNFVGEEAIVDAREAFRLEGYVLSNEGELYPSTLDGLTGVSMTAALEA